MRRRTYLAALLVVGLTAAACGGSADNDEPSSPTTAASTAPSTSEPDSTAQPAETDEGTESADQAESAATVSIDGVAYEFSGNGPAATCKPDFFGGFTAVLYSPDLAHVFSATLWNEGTGDGQQVTEAYMNIEVNGEILKLEANPESSWPAAEAGSSFVEQFTYEGNSASGTIRFINAEVAYDESLAPLVPVLAEFDIVCADG